MAISTYASHAPLSAQTRDVGNTPVTTNPAKTPTVTPATPVVQRNAIKAASAATSDARTSRKTTVDSSTGDLVYQVIDNHTGQKLDQSPEEAMLRIRAYVRQMDATKQADAIIPKADAKS